MEEGKAPELISVRLHVNDVISHFNFPDDASLEEVKGFLETALNLKKPLDTLVLQVKDAKGNLIPIKSSEQLENLVEDFKDTRQTRWEMWLYT